MTSDPHARHPLGAESTACGASSPGTTGPQHAAVADSLFLPPEPPLRLPCSAGLFQVKNRRPDDIVPAWRSSSRSTFVKFRSLAEME
jgi:hypothetical protein